jgi:type II secretory pathway component PulJ
LRLTTIHSRRRLGLGLAEMMMAVMITAILLTAAAAALNASFKAYAINQEQATLMQQARIAMYRMCTMIRTCDAHAPYNSTPLANFSVGVTVTDQGISMFDINNNEVTYRYDAASKQLLCITGATQNTLLEGVEQFDVTMEPMKSEVSARTAGSYDLLRRASITLGIRTTSSTAKVGESTGVQVVSLSTSVAPRQNAW